MTAPSVDIDTHRSLITADQEMVEGMAKSAAALLLPLLTFLTGAAYGEKMNIGGDS